MNKLLEQTVDTGSALGWGSVHVKVGCSTWAQLERVQQQTRQAPFNENPSLSGEGSGGGRTKVIEHESHLHHTCAPS